MTALAAAGWMTPGCIVTVELAHNEDLLPPHGFEAIDERRYGAAKIVILQDGRHEARRAPLYMLRHGETAWNTERRMQGSKNSDLTARGRVQALAMGRTLKARTRARARSDDLPAQPARPHARDLGNRRPANWGSPPRDWRDDIRLAELSYGTWEGFSWAEIEIDHPTALADWRADPHGYCPPGGETHIDLRRRCEPCWRRSRRRTRAPWW